MKRESVGTLVVVDAERKPVGIVTDRDLALRVVAEGLDPRATTVGEVMTEHPRWVREDTPIEDATARMRDLGVRRVPVVDARGRLVGILSVNDVLELVTEELSHLGRIVASSHGMLVPSEEMLERTHVPDTTGLERASADLEC
jgi:signal-transduction protein with cAMP-binding, CBS, and nucleotidyltransferase domain